MAGLAIITEACIDVKDRACVDVCPVQCIYEFDPANNVLFSEVEAGSGVIENTHTPTPDAIDDLRRQHPLREPRRVHVVHRLLPARRVPGRGDLLRGARARRQRRTTQVQLRRPEQGPRPHVLHPAQPRRLRRLNRLPSVSRGREAAVAGAPRSHRRRTERGGHAFPGVGPGAPGARRGPPRTLRRRGGRRPRRRAAPDDPARRRTGWLLLGVRPGRGAPAICTSSGWTTGA